jgi:hypothetical protein
MEYEPLMRGSMPEEEVFPLKGEAALAPAKSPKLKRRAAVAGALLGLSVGALAAVAATRQSTKSAAPTAFGETTSTQERYYTLLPAEKGALAGLAVSNKYIASDRTRPDSYPWLGESEVILEPFRDTTFSMLMIGNLIGSKASDSYEWKITRPPKMQNKYELDLKAYRRRVLESKGMSKEEIDELEPEYDDGVVFSKTVTKDVVSSHSNTRFPVVHAFDELGLHVVSVTDTSTGESVSAKVHVKYVRQEMRKVDKEDREALFAAWKVLMETSDTEGVATYGSNFMSHGRLSTEHNNLAGDRLCDHLHDGMGFVPGHLQVTRLLEASLQSVDSSVALPYWEYTIDVENIIANNDGHFQAWRDIPAFTNEWFGKTDIKSGFVREGHFKDMSLEGNEFTTVSNSWGLIRAPWNNLKNPRFARFFGGGSALDEEPVIMVNEDQMSTCEVVAETLLSSTTLGTFNGAAAGQAHGPIHMFTGGQSNTPDLSARLTHIGFKASGPTRNQFWGTGVTFFFASIKSLYRYHLYNCPESCDSEKSEMDCACTCSTEEIMNSDAKDALFSTWTSNWEEQGLDGDETLTKMLNLLCDDYHNVAMGDHASSGATSDPSFWLIHGTVERWLQLIRLNDYFDNEDWETPVFDSNIHPYSDSCEGHHKADTLVFGAIDGNDFTNREYYDYLNPKLSNLPYVYDDFKWNHCTALGYDFQGLITSAQEVATSGR